MSDERNVYTEDDLQALDPIAAIRRHEQLYCGADGFSCAGTAGLIVDGARVCGVSVEASDHDGIWVIAAEQDWFPTGDDRSPLHSLMAFPEQGVNSFRPEILLACFASLAISISRTTEVVVDLEGRARSALAAVQDRIAGPGGRTLVFAGG